MHRTWGEVRKKVLDLGVEKETTYNKKKDVFIRAANQWQNYLSQTARPFIEKFAVTNKNIPNLLGDVTETRYSGQDIVFSAAGAKAYYFECDGNGLLTISGDEETEVHLRSAGGFVAYRGFVSDGASLTFSGEHTYNLQNVALYGETISDDVNDIPAYRDFIPYDLAELTKVNGEVVFMDFAEDSPVHQGDEYVSVSDYKKQGRSTILLKSTLSGEYDVWYKRYPAQIPYSLPNNQELDDYELELDVLAADILPYYMAYQIWYDDDPTTATGWFNAAENMRAELLAANTLSSSGSSYENTSGWW